jgi:hypothetical protein
MLCLPNFDSSTFWVFAESVLFGLTTTKELTGVTNEYFKAKSSAFFVNSVLFSVVSRSFRICLTVKYAHNLSIEVTGSLLLALN